MHSDVLKVIQPDYLLPDPEQLAVEVAEQDPLCPESLADQTARIVKLIGRARDAGDATLLRSLRRELLLTRWALAKSIAGDGYFALRSRQQRTARRQSSIAPQVEADTPRLWPTKRRNLITP